MPECSAHDELPVLAVEFMGDEIDEHYSRFPDHVMMDVAPVFEQGLHPSVFSGSPPIAQLTFLFRMSLKQCLRADAQPNAQSINCSQRPLRFTHSSSLPF